MTEEMLSLIQENPVKFNEFLLESYKCMQSACQLFEYVSGSSSVSNIFQLNYFCKILRPAWEVDKSLVKNSELKNIHKELLALSKNFTDHNLLPIESLVTMINGTASTKIFKKLFAEISTDESSSPNRNIEFEIEEFRNRLESCEILLTRRKPHVSQEWINNLKRQINSKAR